jgi:rhodanese-related sulfurtransferase
MFIVVQEPEAAKPAEIMNELGIENAFNLTGGILAGRREIVSP